MAKFSGPTRLAPQVRSPIADTSQVALTFEGGAGYGREPKSELFLLAVANMVGEQTFYEAAADRDTRFRDLIRKVVAEDPAWLQGFVPYLRDEMQMRSASVVAAAEYVAAGGPRGRVVVASALQRADEPAEILGYWLSRYGRRIPKPLKRGVADAAGRLYTQRSALRYDGQARSIRMGDVIDLVHPEPKDAEQSVLFRYLLDSRHNRPVTMDSWGEPLDDSVAELTGEVGYGRLGVLFENWRLWSKPVAERRAILLEGGPTGGAERLRSAGMSWETLSSWLEGPMDRTAWEAIIPTMGYMALLRNLRNFDEAGVSDEVASKVADKLMDPDEVANSRQFPIRFYSAWEAVQGMRWAVPLETALDLSVRSVPVLTGRSLILIDASGSMGDTLSARTQVQRWKVAGLFGIALAKRHAADVFAYSSEGHYYGYGQVSQYRLLSPAILVGEQTSVLRALPSVWEWPGRAGGTQTWEAVQRSFVPGRHDRIVILTDEQAHDSAGSLPVPVYTFNLAGYRYGHGPSGKDGRHTFAGLTDAAFRMLPLLERGRDAGWPWEG